MIRQKLHHFRNIWVRGWEPLGVNGSYVANNQQGSHIVNNNYECTCLKELQCTSDSHANYVDFCGGWGAASFSLETLLYRARRGLAEFSDDITSFTSVRFAKIIIWGVPTANLDWVLVGSTHFANQKQELKNWKKYAQPLKMMLKPHRLFVPSRDRTRKKLFFKKKYYAGTQFTNEFYDKLFFYDKPFFNYIWSYVDLDLPVGVPQNDQFYTSLLGSNIYKNEWYKKKSENWLDREEYSKDGVKQGIDSSVFSSWSAFIQTAFNNLKTVMFGKSVKQGPMQPPVLLAPKLQQASFFYNIQLQAAGRSVAASAGGTASEIPIPKCPCQLLQADAQCSAHLEHSEVGPNGTISSETFGRIVGTDNQDELSLTSAEESDSSNTGESETEEIQEQADETQYPHLRRILELLQKK